MIIETCDNLNLKNVLSVEKKKISSPVRAKWNKNHMLPTVSSQLKLQVPVTKRESSKRFRETLPNIKGYQTSRGGCFSPISMNRAKGEAGSKLGNDTFNNSLSLTKLRIKQIGQASNHKTSLSFAENEKAKMYETERQFEYHYGSLVNFFDSPGGDLGPSYTKKSNADSPSTK